MEVKILRDRNFKVGNLVRSYDFPGPARDRSSRDCYIEGVVFRNRSKDHGDGYVDIIVTADVWKGQRVTGVKSRTMSEFCSCPTGRSDFSGRHALFKVVPVGTPSKSFELPVLFPASHPSTGAPIIIEYPKMGYYTVSIETHADKSDYWCWPARVIEAAIAGSMFGWHVPAARKAKDAAEAIIGIDKLEG